MNLLIPLILESCFLFKLSALNKHNHRKKYKEKKQGQHRHSVLCKHSCIFLQVLSCNKNIHKHVPTCLRVDQNTARRYACRFQGKQKEASASRCHLPAYATIKGKRVTSADSWIDGRRAMRRLA